MTEKDDTAREFRELVRRDLKEIFRNQNTLDRRVTIIEANNKWGNIMSRALVGLLVILLALASKIIWWTG